MWILRFRGTSLSVVFVSLNILWRKSSCSFQNCFQNLYSPLRNRPRRKHVLYICQYLCILYMILLKKKKKLSTCWNPPSPPAEIFSSVRILPVFLQGDNQGSSSCSSIPEHTHRTTHRHSCIPEDYSQPRQLWLLWKGLMKCLIWIPSSVAD